MQEIWWVLMFQVRSQLAALQLAGRHPYGSIAYEYEKNSYPLAMADLAWGESSAALDFLQQLDSQAVETQGIDLLSGFTLKGQMRKYFYFGDRLDPAYRQRMWEAMDEFTRSDPLIRAANPPRKFWERSRDDCGTPVDCRNTDNLRAMRETSLYLMAEETGNEATRLIYQQRLQRYVSTLLDIGMGEWDSPVYHGHTTAAYLNLYDFAQDPEVKQLAKTALDWLFQAAAIKYWRGDWNGPAKRLNGNGAAHFFWLYFGDAAPPEVIERNWLYALTSDYLPPDEVVAIAQRQFAQPLEIRRTHPHYENWKPHLYGPAFYETTYIGHTYQLGSLVKGTGGDWSGFSLRVATDDGGTGEFQVNADHPHAIAQYENLLIWYGTEEPELRFPDATVETLDDVTFLVCDQTWIALHRFAQGFALEIGELQTHGNFDSFKRQVLARSRLTATPNRIDYQSSTGETLAVQMDWSSDHAPAPGPMALPQVWRDHIPYDWSNHHQDWVIPFEEFGDPAPLLDPPSHE
ncbi:MAG: hypothetical protein AB4042_19565 [Leptolyngbyaceae cyanobacterium]